MNRSDLVQRLSKLHPQLLAKDSEQAVNEIIGAISNTLANGERVEIRGFGCFVVNHRPPRTGRNPKTGVTVNVPAKNVPHFRAGKELRERVDPR
jgi:integration host factor subunit beta